MKLKDFLMTKTHADQLCIIRDHGWRIAAAYIDSEDLFLSGLHPDLLNTEVIGSIWGSLTLTGQELKSIGVLYIDIKR